MTIPSPSVVHRVAVAIDKDLSGWMTFADLGEGIMAAAALAQYAAIW
jgi:hypothetical protein